MDLNFNQLNEQYLYYRKLIIYAFENKLFFLNLKLKKNYSIIIFIMKFFFNFENKKL